MALLMTAAVAFAFSTAFCIYRVATRRYRRATLVWFGLAWVALSLVAGAFVGINALGHNNPEIQHLLIRYTLLGYLLASVAFVYLIKRLSD